MGLGQEPGTVRWCLVIVGRGMRLEPDPETMRYGVVEL